MVVTAISMRPMGRSDDEGSERDTIGTNAPSTAQPQRHVSAAYS